MLREWLLRLRDAFFSVDCLEGGVPVPDPSPKPARTVRTHDGQKRHQKNKKTTHRDPNKCLELVHTDETHISPKDALLPVLGSLVMTMCWGYYLWITSPPLPKFITSMFPSLFK